ncbi:MAG: methionyl-tRNA formyltransferase [Candidatus Omnitrophica bacterium]|nr:methionyl-tRNA formyltransferase [Candidatus Omnitrophota bacterium]
MRLIFFGTGAFAVPSLERLVQARHHLVGCFTQPGRPQGRGLRLEPSPVKQAAQRLGVPVAEPARLDAAALAALKPEAGVVIDYGRILRRDVLGAAARGMLGVHPSLLPKYRGASPVAWALLQGERETGVTVFRLNERMDAGDILRQRTVPIEPGDTTEALTQRLAALGAEELVRGLEALAGGQAAFRPQEEARASVTAKLTKAQGVIDWRQPAAQLDRLVRAMGTWPGAMTACGGQPLKVLAASVGAAAASGAVPGTVVRVAADAIEVAAGEGALVLRDVQPAGRRRMSVREFLAGHSIQVGDMFGTHA